MSPDFVLRYPGLAIATSWDDCDELTETLSGGGTLHDTFRICYQNIPEVMPNTSEMDSSENSEPYLMSNTQKRKD